MDIYSIREPMPEPKQPHLSHTDKNRISSHDKFMDNISQKIVRQHNQILRSNISDDVFKADMYRTMDKIKESLFEIHERTKDIQVSIPEAIPPDLLNNGKNQANSETLNYHFTGLSKDLTSSVKILQKDLDLLAASITSLERKSNAMVDYMQTLIKTLQDVSGTQSGSRSKLDHLQLLTNLAHDKLSVLEDASKKSQDHAKVLQDVIYSHSSWVSSLFLYAAIFQVVLIGAYILYKRAKGHKSGINQHDRKFI